MDDKGDFSVQETTKHQVLARISFLHQQFKEILRGVLQPGCLLLSWCPPVTSCKGVPGVSSNQGVSRVSSSQGVLLSGCPWVSSSQGASGV